MIQKRLVLRGGRRVGKGRALPLTIVSFLLLSPLGYDNAIHVMFFSDWSHVQLK